jgi:L-fucose isomerase-like protein
VDLSEVFLRVRGLDRSSEQCRSKAERLRHYTQWAGVPEEAFETLVKLAVVLDDIMVEFGMDALALRCWIEIEKELRVSPCVLLSEINDRGIPAACELDVCNAVAMRALSLASGRPAACLDWNNNYADEQDKCILFHCGPVAQGLMAGKGRVIEHPMFAKALGAGCGYGCNVGRIAPGPFTFASSKTQDGKLTFYLGDGGFTQDAIPADFFGCAGTARIDDLQAKLQTIGYQGYRHHVSVTPGHLTVPLAEAWTRYLGYSRCEL